MLPDKLKNLGIEWNMKMVYPIKNKKTGQLIGWSLNKDGITAIAEAAKIDITYDVKIMFAPTGGEVIALAQAWQIGCPDQNAFAAVSSNEDSETPAQLAQTRAKARFVAEKLAITDTNVLAIIEELRSTGKFDENGIKEDADVTAPTRKAAPAVAGAAIGGKGKDLTKGLL
jgi:hypothetical protein